MKNFNNKIVILILFFLGFFNYIQSQEKVLELIKNKVEETTLSNINDKNFIKKIKNQTITKSISLFKPELDSLKFPDRIKIDLSDAGIFIAEKIEVEQFENDQYLWKGRIQNDGVISIFNDKGRLTGHIIIRQDSYTIEPITNGIHILIKKNNETLKKATCGLDDEISIDSNAVDYLNKNILPRLESIISPTQDLLVAYTAEVAANHTNMYSFIQSVIGATEVVYYNSGISVDLRLVHYEQISYTETEDLSIDLSNFRNNSLIQQSRSKYIADMCVLFVDDPEPSDDGSIVIGTAYQYGGTSYAFAVVVDDYAGTSNWTLAHELGHVQGAHHKLPTVNINYSYGHGFISNPGDLRTIMAYDDPNCYGGSCTKIPYFSNPNINIDGYIIGSVQNEDNSRVLNETRTIISGHNNATMSGTLSHDEVWRDTYTIEGIIFVPSGVTLTIKSGSTINLSSYSIIANGGTIVREGGSAINGIRAYLKNGSTTKGYCALIQTACTYAANGDRIEIQTGVYYENLSFSGKNNLTIQGQCIIGNITVYNSSSLNINLVRSGKVYLSNCTNATLNLEIYPQEQTGLSTYNSSLTFHGGILASAIAFAPGYYTTASITGTYQDRTEIWGCGTAVFAGYSSNINLNEFIELCDVDNYHLHVSNNSHITATNCFYNSDGIPKKRIDGAGSTINTPGGSYECNLSKENIYSSNHENPESLSKINNSSEEIIQEEFKRINKNYFNLTNQISEDISRDGFFNRDKFNSDYTEVKNDFKNFISHNPDNPLVKTALATITQCFKQMGSFNEMKLFLDEMSSNKKFTSQIALIKRFILDYYITQESYEEAILLADDIMNEFVDDEDLLADILYIKGLILLYNIDKKEQASESFLKLRANYPNNLLVSFADHELQSLGKDSDENSLLITEGNQFSSTNYPNPFNPITTISYSLPNDEKVVLKIYDILGREVAELVNEFKTAGKYNVEFNASNLSSGIYFYSINAGSLRQVKKMVLTK